MRASVGMIGGRSCREMRGVSTTRGRYLAMKGGICALFEVVEESRRGYVSLMGIEGRGYEVRQGHLSRG